MVLESSPRKYLCITVCIYLYISIVIPNSIKLLGKVGISDIMLAVLLLIYFLAIVKSEEKPLAAIYSRILNFVTRPLSVSLLTLFTVMLTSVSYAPSKGIALTESIRLVTYISLGFIIISEFNTEDYIKYIINTILLSTLTLNLLGIAQYFTKIGISTYVIIDGLVPRVEATMGNPNAYGAYLVITIFPCIMLFLYEKNKRIRILYLILCALTLINLALSLSRNSWLSFGIGLIILAIIYNWKFIFVILLGGGAISFIPSIASRIKQFGDAAQNEGRINIWKIALKMIKEHPIKGIGNGNFVVLYDHYVEKYPEYKMEGYEGYPTHNSYLKIQSEVGIFGFLSFVIAILSGFRNLFVIINRNKDYYRYFYTGFLVSAFSMLILNLFDNILFVPQVAIAFWSLLFTTEVMKNKA